MSCCSGEPRQSSFLLMPFVLATYLLIVLSHILVFSIACLGLNILFGHGRVLLARTRNLFRRGGLYRRIPVQVLRR